MEKLNKFHYIDEYGNEIWNLNDEAHREDGPAIIMAYGAQYWCKHGKNHRLDGPAVIYPNGKVVWYVEGALVLNWEEFQILSGISDEQRVMLTLQYGEIQDPFVEV